MTGRFKRPLVAGAVLLAMILLLSAGLTATGGAAISRPLQLAAQTKTSPGETQKKAAALPRLVTMTAGEPTSGNYLASVGLRAAVEKFSPMQLRLEPYDTDLARMVPLRSGETQFTHQTGLVAYWVSRGTEYFKNWGPTPLRRVWKGKPFVGAMYARGDSGIKTIADLRGKRIPQTPAAKAWSMNNESILLFGGLTLKDVQVVTVSSINAGLKGPLEGNLDATQGSPWSAAAQELASSRYGIKWLDMPASDKAGWLRYQKLMPWAGPVQTTAAGLKTGEKMWQAGYERGIYAYPNVPDEVVYAIVKALKEGYNVMSPMHPDLVDWTWDWATSTEGLLDIPFHEGAVKFLKDNGAWTSDLEAFQQAQVREERERIAKK